MQLTHYNTIFKNHKFPIVLVCDNITNAPNLGSLFRTADAFGVEKLILCGEHILIGKKLRKTSRATEKVVKYNICNSAIEVVKSLKNKDFHIISLEITTHSQSIKHFKLDIKNPIALVIGNENFGISEDLLKLSDAIIHIPMYGQNSSMNVVQATTIALYEMTKQIKTQ